MASLGAGCIVGVAAVVFHREAKAVIAPIAGFSKSIGSSLHSRAELV